MKITVLACLVAVCCAQPQPVKPILPETFASKFNEFVRHGAREVFAIGLWLRSVDLKKFVEVVTVAEGPTYKYIGDFSSEISYEINGTKCEARKMEGQPEFPDAWRWLDEAHFHEFKDPRTNKTYDAWSEESDRGSRTLLLLATDPSKPVALIERRMSSREGPEEIDRRFSDFDTVDPSPTAFKPPETCAPPPPRHH